MSKAWLTVWVLVTLMALPVLTSTAAPSDLPPYILNKGSGFAVYTNKHWRAEGIGAVKELEKRDPGTYGSKDRSFRIWTRTCKPGQKVTFTRNIELLGRPSSIRASVDMGLAMDYYDIFFNSRKVSHSSTSFDNRDLKQLHAGLNDIDLVVKLQKSPTACTNFQEPPRRGVWFDLDGSFSADLRVGKPQKPVEYKDAPEGANQVVIVAIVNLGSATIREGTFEISTGGPGWCVERKPDNTCVRYQFFMITLGPASTGDVTCVDDDVYHQTSKCTFKDLRPGHPYKVGVGIKFTPDSLGTPGWVEEYRTISWHGRIAPGGPSDPDSSNNDNSVRIVFCRYGATDTGCKPKPA